MPSRVSGAPFCAPRRLRGQGAEAGVPSSSAGIGDPASASQPAALAQRAARRRSGQEQGAEQVLGGRAPQVAAGVVVDGEDEVRGEPVGGLDRRQPGAAGSTTSAGRMPVMRCGSNSHTVLPDPARSCAVAAHRSALLLVATTAPGADRT